MLQMLWTSLIDDRPLGGDVILTGCGQVDVSALDDLLEERRTLGDSHAIVTFDGPPCFVLDPTTIPGATAHPDCPRTAFIQLNV